MNSTREIMAATLLAVALLVPGQASAGDVILIGHSDVNLTAADIRDVYLGEKTLAGAVKLLPVDNSALQAQFLEKAIKMDAAKYGAIWTKKTFRDAVTPPPIKGGDAEVMAFVKSTAGAVGYVSTAPSADVKTLGKF